MDRTRPWERDTLVNVWSTTKGLVALCVQVLVDRGQLDVDVPVATYWPEFAAAGKEELPVRYLLSHRAGLTGPREPLAIDDLYDWDRVTGVLAATEPWWTPGEISGYHALTFGYLVGEVIRRMSGRSPGSFFAEEIADPLGLDAHIGLPTSEHGRVAELRAAPQPEGSDFDQMFAQMAPAALAALANPGVGAAIANTPAWREAEIPAANGHATAAAIAGAYQVYLDGGERSGKRLLSAEGTERIRQGQGPGADRVLGAGMAGLEMEFGLGVILSGPLGAYGPNPLAFGHDGYGGSYGMVDPEAGVAVGYVMNHMGNQLNGDPRKMAVIAAINQSL